MDMHKASPGNVDMHKASPYMTTKMDIKNNGVECPRGCGRTRGNEEKWVSDKRKRDSIGPLGCGVYRNKNRYTIIQILSRLDCLFWIHVIKT